MTDDSKFVTDRSSFDLHILTDNWSALTSERWIEIFSDRSYSISFATSLLRAGWQAIVMFSCEVCYQQLSTVINWLQILLTDYAFISASFFHLELMISKWEIIYWSKHVSFNKWENKLFLLKGFFLYGER